MNSDISEGKWKELKGKAKAQWGSLTDDDLDEINGKREQFLGVVQKKYGKSREEAEQEFEEFQRNNDLQ